MDKTTEFVQIINPDPFSFSYSIENNDCFNTAPEAHITITGATPPYDINDVQFTAILRHILHLKKVDQRFSFLETVFLGGHLIH